MFDITKATRELAHRYYSAKVEDHDDLTRLAKAIRTNCHPGHEPAEVTTLLGPRHGWKRFSQAA